MNEYLVLRRILTWLFWRLGRPIAERFVVTVIYSALDWDISPSELHNIMDEYLNEICGL